MKKIILTLGIVLSAYATYATSNSNNEINVEEDFCTKDIYVYENGVLMTIIHDQPC
ncbi:hypothetical protein [Aquimarina algiphila]|uniref:hypothetical protein n=1 Tax=Aquimarina algiphila TaxID=2047982 RepID=UPI0014301BAD|nr:hypothetical protein [Aquimarina algiphila]